MTCRFSFKQNVSFFLILTRSSRKVEKYSNYSLYAPEEN